MLVLRSDIWSNDGQWNKGSQRGYSHLGELSDSQWQSRWMRPSQLGSGKGKYDRGARFHISKSLTRTFHPIATCSS